MRLFIALDLPSPVRATLAATQTRLRRSDLAVRWAAVEGMHLTLQFLGESDPSLVPALLAGLAAIPPPAFHLQLAGLGVFPTPQRPRVVWVGLNGDLAALHDLHAQVLAATRPLGFLPEARTFAPHLTLGRVRPEPTTSQLQAITHAIHSVAPPAPLDWDVASPQLFHSQSTPQGMVYHVLGSL
ncbi:RNA 2',3'-cyclic phosphodiesterase [Candidatus Oscillochloris fontis]|uniref:RNA 2',3'-cyclic phosphodiesterase n=1 Tax=Candidatus Oscillochloris fontis TaxID=2496868 RepID=UPI00101D722E|nr:RNA 2',3'-cyclic phosphodiesterase [Candidatus Oscillochloris fontis]